MWAVPHTVVLHVAELLRHSAAYYVLTRRRGAHTAHTQIGRPTHEAPISVARGPAVHAPCAKSRPAQALAFTDRLLANKDNLEIFATERVEVVALPQGDPLPQA